MPDSSVKRGRRKKDSIPESALRGFKYFKVIAGYGQYSLFEDILNVKSSFVARLKDNAVWQTIEERPITEDDRLAGVQRDMIVRLGSPQRQDDLSIPVRVVEIFHRGSSNRPRRSRVSSKKTFRTADSDYTMLLVTDRTDLFAESKQMTVSKTYTNNVIRNMISRY
ncbi:MAG: hypothetical protein HY753_09255 [Nitrospirae bacterium]|nr:hypothetical protein [Nitrospirota bacterium]